MPIQIRPDLASLTAYKPGKAAPPGQGGPGGVFHKLSSNENPFPPLPGVIEAATTAAQQMHRYPDASNLGVAEAVAADLSLDGAEISSENLAFSTGSVAVLFQILQTLCSAGDEVVYAWRSFEAYPLAVQLSGARSVQVPLREDGTHDLAAMRAAITDRTKVVMVCTPNNPTGPAVNHDELISFVDSVPDDVLVLVDEAYVEFVTDPDAVRGLEVLAGRDNVVVLRTFSKAYGLAGFRVGYAAAQPDLAAAFRSVAVPFGVSVPAQAAVLASLAAKPTLIKRVAELVERRDALRESLLSLGFDVPESQANFIWLKGEARTQEFTETFADLGIIVRPFAVGQPWDGVRISIGDPEANELVLRAATTLSGKNASEGTSGGV